MNPPALHPHAAAEDPAGRRYNLPQLGLASDAALVQRLRGVETAARIKAFVKAELPALMARVAGAQASGPAAPAGADLPRTATRAARNMSCICLRINRPAC